jgi:exonuclease SbcC
MHFNYIKFSGFRPFLQPVAVDFDALPGRIIALTGPNGAGKTRFLELLAGGVFRSMPTRGKVNALAADRKTTLEVGVTTDQRYVLKQIIDGQTSRAEAVVIGANGLPLTDSGKLPEFDAWVAKHLPSENVLFATSFAAQGEAGFFGLSKTDRKAVMLRALLIEHYEGMAENARTKLRDAQSRLETTLARYGELSRDVKDVEVLRAAFEATEREAATAAEQLTAARTALRELKATAEEVNLKIAANKHARETAATLDDRIAAAGAQLIVIDERMQQANVILARRAEIETAIDRIADLDDRISASQSLIEEKKAAISAASEKMATRQAELAGIVRSQVTDEARAESLRKRLADRETIDAAVIRLPELETALSALTAERDAAWQALEQLRATKLDDATGRITKLRTAHESIRDWEDPRGCPVGDDVFDVKKISETALTADDKAVEAAILLPEALIVAEREHAALSARLHDATVEIGLYRQTAGRQPQLAENQRELEAVEETLRAALLDKENCGHSLARATELRGTLNTERAELEAAQRVIQDERGQVHLVAVQRAQLEQAEARLVELTTERADVASTKDRLAGERTALVIEADPEEVDLRYAELDVSSAEATARDTLAARHVADTMLQAAIATAARLAELDAARVADETEVADWTRLSFELGRDGLQALEIDAAGPELTELVNDLLHNCFGNRWTVAIETVRDAKSSKKQVEVFDGIVFDSEEGEKTFEQLSGGQKVIIGEAFSLALTMVACRRAGISHPMLIRDETGAALDGDAGPAYVSMLRRAADIVGASKVIFVSHNAELHALADAQLHVEKGIVSVNESNEAAALRAA